MAGIISFGAYVPYNRLDRKKIKEQFGTPVPKGEKAVANYDEDSLTMAVNAALNITASFDASGLEAVYFASTTSPFAEKQAAVTLAAVLTANEKIRTADFGGSLRASSAAILSAIDVAKGGGCALVAAADCRLGKASGVYEAAFGDAGASLVFGNKDVIARVVGTSSIVHDLPDVWRNAGDRFVQGWDDKYTAAKGFVPFVTQAAGDVLRKTGLQTGDFRKVVISSPRPKSRLEAAVKMGFAPEQLQESYFETIGDAGNAQAPLMLIGALEEAKPGERILYVSYGEGADAIVFEVTDEILKQSPRGGISGYLKNKKNTLSYGKYLRWKGLLEIEPPKRPNPTRASISAFNRNYAKNYRLSGSRCTTCGTVHFPPQLVCSNCNSIRTLESCSFLRQQAKLVTFTCDYLAYCEDPPMIAAVIDFANGGRIMTSLVDIDQEELQVGMELAMSFRKVNDAEGVKTYFWKAVPKRS